MTDEQTPEEKTVSKIEGLTIICVTGMLIFLIVATLSGCASGPTTIQKGQRVSAPYGQIKQCIEDPDQPACTKKAIPQVDIKP
jgi:uncharacterized protein YceK